MDDVYMRIKFLDEQTKHMWNIISEDMKVQDVIARTGGDLIFDYTARVGSYLRCLTNYLANKNDER